MEKRIQNLEKQIQILEQKKQKLQQARIQKIGHLALQSGLGPINNATIYNAFAFIKRQIDAESEISKSWQSDDKNK